jgi:HEAT repeat protein
MKHIFISYHRGDADFATILRLELEKAGHEVWVDDSAIAAGADWRSEIDQGIQEAKALVVVMSPEAAKSEYVTYEWAFAIGRGVPVVPVVVRSTTLHPRLEAIQYLDFTSHGARPWQKLLAVVAQAPHRQRSEASILATKNTPLIERAVTALDSMVPEERRLALETLSQSNDPGARKAVMNALRHSLLDVRVAAAVDVCAYDPDASLPGLVEGLAFHRMTENWEGRIASGVRWALVGIGSKAIPALHEALKSANGIVWANAVEVLGEIGDHSAVPSFIEKLRTGRKGGFLDGRHNIVEALGKVGDESAAEPLMEVIADRTEDDYTVRDAIWSLGKIGSSNAAPFLADQLPRQPRENQTAIVVVLGLLGDDCAVPALTKLLPDHELTDYEPNGVKRKPVSDLVADALRKIGSEEALSALQSADG